MATHNRERAAHWVQEGCHEAFTEEADIRQRLKDWMTVLNQAFHIPRPSI